MTRNPEKPVPIAKDMAMLKTSVMVASLTMLLLSLVMPAYAAPDKQTEVVTSGFTSDPTLVEHPDRVFKALDRGESPAALGATTRSSEAQRPLSPNDPRQQALRSKNDYVTHAAQPPSTPAAFAYDYITPDECKAHEKESGSDEGWIKNHFAYCQRSLAWARSKKCSSRGCVKIGDVQIVVTLIGYGKAGALPGSSTSRYVEYDMHLDNVKADGRWLDDDATWSISIQCTGNPTASACHPGNKNGGKASINTWSKNRYTTFQFVSPGKTPSQAHGQQIAYGFMQTVSVFAAPGAKIEPGKAYGAQHAVRFDSAWYLTPYKLGSIFPQVRAFLAFSLDKTKGYEQASGHILKAFTQNTNPPYKDKPKHLPGGNYKDPYTVPQGLDVPPLSRLYPGLSKTNKTRYNRNNYYARKACNKYFPGWNTKKDPDGQGYECDEYPFRSTYEGAARYLYDGKKYENLFSALPIRGDENGNAGNMLGVWYGHDRILDADNYFIKLEK